jgi:hypothetical protein
MRRGSWHLLADDDGEGVFLHQGIYIVRDFMPHFQKGLVAIVK